jgi:hypothetical protein
LGSEEVVIPNPGPLTESDSAAIADRDSESVTRAEKLEVPAAEGVPEMVPPAASERPEGSDPEETDQM